MMFGLGIAETMVLFIGGLPLAVVVGGVFLVALKILKGSSKDGTTQNRAEEARMIQDIYHGLLKMEQRVDALETILLDRDTKGDSTR